MKKLFIVVIFFCSSILLNATHIIGGEIYYDCLGNGQYRITIKVYRDCYNGQAPFDNPATLSIWNAGNSLVDVIELDFPGSVNVPFTSSNPCFQAPPNVCVEEAVYQTVVTLSSSPSGYTFAYQRCCRNNTIVNIVNPGGTGATYFEKYPLQNNIVCNSSPRFKNFPPIAICIGDSLVFDHSAIDTDGDSLVYKLCATYSGANTVNPKPYSTSTPPFSNIVFSNPYSATYPIASANPAVAIDPVTGILKLNPTMQGQYVVGVCVEEWRNGVLIGTHFRDFQFNVTICQTNVFAGFDLPPDAFITNGVLTLCGTAVNFINQSTNASYYYWNFGDPNSNSDTSSLINPFYQYTDTGTYTIMLVANPGYFCADTANITLKVLPPMDIDFAVPASQCIDNNNFQFQVQGTYYSTANFTWDFTSHATPSTSNNIQVNGVTFDTSGTHIITLFGQDQQCADTATHEIYVWGHPLIDLNIPLNGCAPHKVIIINNTFNNNNVLTYTWDFNGFVTLYGPNPTYTFPNTGNYTISVDIQSLTGCKDQYNFQFPVIVSPSPTAYITAEPDEASIFNPVFYFFPGATGNFLNDCWVLMDNGDSIPGCVNFSYVFDEPGTYYVAAYAINTFGCLDTAIYPVTVNPEFTFFIPNTFTVNGDGLNDVFRGFGIGIRHYEFRIYDRWGHVLYSSESIEQGWNGAVNNTGKKVPTGIYVYSVDLIDVFGLPHSYRGKVLLSKKANSKF